MDRWWSQLYCARMARAFNLMPWPYKVLDLSDVLLPISTTWCLQLAASDITRAEHARPAWMAWVLVAGIILVWRVYVQRLSLLFRGEQALREGIAPTSDVKLSNPKYAKNEWYGVVAWSMVCACIVLLILAMQFSLPAAERSVSAVALPCFFSALVWQQVVLLFRNRFLAASLNATTDPMSKTASPVSDSVA